MTGKKKRDEGRIRKVKLLKRLFWYSTAAITGAGLIFTTLFFLVYIGVFGHISTVRELQNIQNYLSSEVYSSDKVLLGKYYLQDRTNVRYQDLPEHLLDALLATEDVRFYEHNGIDKKSSLRVLVKSILFQNRSSGGGSTIHQQLAKIFIPGSSILFLRCR